MPRFLIVLFFALLSLPGFSQEETETPPAAESTTTTKEALSPGGGQVIIHGHAEEPVESLPGSSDTRNEDAIVNELEAAREERLKKLQMVEKATEPLKDPIKNPLKELQELGHKQINAVALMDSKVQAVVQRLIKEGHMARISADALKAQIMTNVKGSFWENILTRFPVLVDIFVEVVRNKEALGGLLGILIRKDDLKNYGYIWLAIFVFAALIKNRIIKPKWPFLKRMAFSMTISLVLTVTSLAIFYNFFSTELDPTLQIIGKHLF